jgi:hypothetical protein
MTYNERTREKIKLSIQAFNIQVNGFYIVQIAAPACLDKTRRVSLEVVDATGKLRKDVSFTYQRSLVEEK